MTSSLELTARGHWLNAWFLYAFGRPVVVIDGDEHSIRWRQPARIPLAAGKHTVSVGFRYVGTPWLLGVRERGYVVPQDGTLRLSAMNGPLNSEPFYVEISGVAAFDPAPRPSETAE
ncbi:hypothetical protein [Gryllotalpicola protaetiae]|uniref:Uncharacterized protein n=1 Tax=Gryllotalpicola protaetiae TaxID=2419771 RepID=A0A387BLK5_9MICO|nr:hypothetical protein [Gryllotalpicola protaetiae]AYG04763.1 hypothetical protein D7I44_15340 [Gryllotalpicola protaetiae]